MLPEGNWIARTDLKRKTSAGQGAGRSGHACTCMPPPRRWAPRPDGRRAALGKAKYSSIFNYPTLTWADIAPSAGW